MKKLFLTVCLGLLFQSAYSQDNNWSGEVYYPISIGDSFGSSNEGLLGVNLGYRFTDLGKGKLGASLDALWFSTTFTNDSDPIQELDYRDFFLQVKAFYETPLNANETLLFRGVVGWAYQRASQSPAMFTEVGAIEGLEINTGPLVGAGLTLALTPRWFVAAQTDFMFMFGESPNRTIGLTKIGVGFKF